jgi:hypothetical protein
MLWGTDCVSVSVAFFHRRHEHLMAARIEQDPLQLLDVGLDEVEQRLSGLRSDLAFGGGD